MVIPSRLCRKSCHRMIFRSNVPRTQITGATFRVAEPSRVPKMYVHAPPSPISNSLSPHDSLALECNGQDKDPSLNMYPAQSTKTFWMVIQIHSTLVSHNDGKLSFHRLQRGVRRTLKYSLFAACLGKSWMDSSPLHHPLTDAQLRLSSSRGLDKPSLPLSALGMFMHRDVART